MQEKTILAPEILELTNLSLLERNLCPVCETWHNRSKKKCVFCAKHNLKKDNTLVFSFKPLLLEKKLNNQTTLLKLSLLSNKFENIFFNTENLNLYFKTKKDQPQKDIQLFDIFVDQIYDMLGIKNINKKTFKSKYSIAFENFIENKARPTNKRILMPMFDSKIDRRKMINTTVKNFF